MDSDSIHRTPVPTPRRGPRRPRILAAVLAEQPPQSAEVQPVLSTATSSVTAVTMRIPQYWLENRRPWFVLVEGQVELARITTERTKFHHVILVLPTDLAMDLSDVLLDTTSPRPYTALKEALLARTTASTKERSNNSLPKRNLETESPHSFFDTGSV